MNRDRAPPRCELDRIREQIIENQPQFAAVGERREVLDLHVEPHSLRDQRELLVLEDGLDQRTQLELRDLETDALRLPGAEGKQVLDEPLQLHAVLAQNRGDLPLSALQLADGTVHQQLRPLADVRVRLLDLALEKNRFLRHMSHELKTPLEGEIEQPHAQPLELRRESLEIGG